MRLRKPYTISESEKERIRGLHNNVKKMLTEDSAEEESYNYGKDMGHDDKELYDLKKGDGSHTHIDDLEDDIHYDREHDWGVHESELEENKMYDAARREHPEFPWDDPIEDHEYSKVDHSDRDRFDGRKSRVVGVDSDIEDQRLEEAEESDQCACPPNHIGLKHDPINGCHGSGCRPIGGWNPGDEGGKISDDEGYGGEPSAKMGPIKHFTTNERIHETALPTGWTMKTLEEIDNENDMDDIYEIWAGAEDDKALRESINDNGTVSETTYKLPARFGNKRLTESQLINMIKTIIK
tara:strand:+ start:66 stop:950 length:885 start_codon:yes stop_codon:yes gene_type:complete